MDANQRQELFSPHNQGKILRLDLPPSSGIHYPIIHEMVRSDSQWQLSTPWSVQWDVDGTAADNLCDVPHCKARLEWGTGGAFHVAYVDWRRGQRILLAGSYVKLDLWILNWADWISTQGRSPEGWPATFRATIAPTGQPTPVRNPTLTVPIGEVGATTYSPWQPVPPFARNVRLQARSAAPPEFNVEFGLGVPVHQVLHQEIVRNVPGRNYGDIMMPTPVPNDATYCRWYNVAAVTSARLEWEIAL